MNFEQKLDPELRTALAAMPSLGDLGVYGAMEQKSGLSKSGRREKRSRYPQGYLHQKISVYGSS